MKKGFLITNGIALFFAIVSVGWLIYDFTAFGILHPKTRLLLPLAKLNQSSRISTKGIADATRSVDPLYTYPAGDVMTRQYVVAMIHRFHPQLDPARSLKSDVELTEDEIHTRMLVIYGSPENHSFFRRVRDRLPLIFESDGVVVGRKKYKGRDVGAIFVCQNPLSPNHLMLIYGAVSPAALKQMNAVVHGLTDYVIFNDTSRQFAGLEPVDCFLLLGAFNKSDPTHWRVDESYQILPPKALQRATASVIVTR